MTSGNCRGFSGWWSSPAWRSPHSCRAPDIHADATGPVSHAVNNAIFLALYLTPWNAPPLSATSDAALLFNGGSMLPTAVRGHAGCKILAVSNWLLRRDDQVRCVPSWPIDETERRLPRNETR